MGNEACSPFLRSLKEALADQRGVNRFNRDHTVEGDDLGTAGDEEDEWISIIPVLK